MYSLRYPAYQSTRQLDAAKADLNPSFQLENTNHCNRRIANLPRFGLALRCYYELLCPQTQAPHFEHCKCKLHNYLDTDARWHRYLRLVLQRLECLQHQIISITIIPRYQRPFTSRCSPAALLCQTFVMQWEAAHTLARVALTRKSHRPPPCEPSFMQLWWNDGTLVQCLPNCHIRTWESICLKEFSTKTEAFRNISGA